MDIPVATLAEVDFLTVDIVQKRRSGHAEMLNLIIFNFYGKAYAYLNRCMHMQRPLNCQSDDIFDRTKQNLRCSMHGFVFEPETGVCISPVCEGQQLLAFKLVETDGLLRLGDKHSEIVAIYRNGKELI
jgi:nitrite reductase/ring-hydroxylating ferredoxin subunit